MKFLRLSYIGFVLLAFCAGVQGQSIIADHTVVDKYTSIPQQYIDSVKKMWVTVPGESHSQGYRRGLSLLEEIDSRFQVRIRESGIPDEQTDQNLRFSRATWGDLTRETGWIYGYGEEDWFTNELGISRTKAGFDYVNNNGPILHATGFGWCWDMSWKNGPAGEIDPDYQVRWAGSTVGGLDGNKIWGIDSNDSLLTGNRINMDNYLSATQEYIDHCNSNSYTTKVFLTTGPVDDSRYNAGEVGYQRFLKTEHIRNYVLENDGLYLFDYADILSWNDNNEQHTIAWTDHGGTNHSFPFIHPDNELNRDGTNTEDGDHIGEIGTIRLAKAMWWMLARLAGWNGLPEGQGDTDPPSVPSDLHIEVLSTTTLLFSWSPSVDNIATEGYIVYKDNVALDTVSECQFLDIVENFTTTCTYGLRAIDSSGNRSERSDDLFFSMEDHLTEFKKELYPGFNWFSINCLPEDNSLNTIFSNLVNEGDYIKNQTSSSTYYDGAGWFGTLQELDQGEMYTIKLGDSLALQFAGIPIHEDSDQISVSEGWNWIGYTRMDSISINEAFQSLTLHEMDYIKDQASSSTYYSDYGWFGTLNNLENGNGYMIKLSEDATLDFPPVVEDHSAKKSLNGWAGDDSGSIFSDFHNFEYNGSLTAKINSGALESSEENLLFAYVDDECRGIARGKYFEPMDEYLYPIMVYSNNINGDQLLFKLYDSNADIFYDIVESVEFEKDMILANAFDPVEFTIVESSVSMLPGRDVFVEVYPVPFNDLLNVSIHADGAESIRIEVIDVYGRIINHQRIEAPDLTLSTRIRFREEEQGIYFLRILVDDKVFHKRVIKE
jgi:hypothetical protein